LAAYASGKQSEKDLRQARELFSKALAEDPRHGKAAFDLAMTHQLLSEPKEALANFRRAIEAEPDYVEARVQYAGALIEEGDPDEAIRQLTEAVRLEPSNDVAHSHLSRAYLDKQVWDRAIEAADKALALKPGNDQALLWKSRRAAPERRLTEGPLRPSGIVRASGENYRGYLSLTNFSTPAHEKLAYYFIGFGLGSRRHADRQVPTPISEASLISGLCDCEQKLGNLLRAEEYCRRAVSMTQKTPLPTSFSEASTAICSTAPKPRLRPWRRAPTTRK